MYLQYFNITERPFELLPDTEYFYEYDCYQEALNVLFVAIRTGEGFIKVTGEVGTGKTMLCRKLLNSLEDGYVTAFIPNPFLTPSQLRIALADELGIDYQEDYQNNINDFRLMKDIIACLMEYNRQGKQVVVCLDEVQTMNISTLEELRLLSNIETEKSKLLQIVMFGQPELDERLMQKDLRQLKQRISFSYNLRPVNRKNISNYINHRLHVAGYSGGNLFSSRAIAKINKNSKGVPRKINILCNKAMMLAFGKGNTNVSYWHVRQAIADEDDGLSASYSINFAITFVGLCALFASILVVAK